MAYRIVEGTFRLEVDMVLHACAVDIMEDQQHKLRAMIDELTQAIGQGESGDGPTPRNVQIH